MSRRLAWLWLAASFAACTFGPRIPKVPVAHGPQGVIVSLTAAGAGLGEKEDRPVFRGELLEARPDGLLLLESPRTIAAEPASRARARLVLVSYAATRGLTRFEKVGLSLDPGRAPSARDLDRLRRLSRFPQGLARELLDALVRDCGQQDVEVWRR